MPDDADDAFAQAMQHARAGDVSGLWRASDDLRPYLARVAAAILRDRLRGKVDASDVVQQGLLASVERFDQFRGETRAEWQAWLVAIVRNEARNLLRYWHQQQRHLNAEDPIVGSRRAKARPDGPSVRLPGADPSPSRQVATRQEATQLLQVLDRLPPEHRAILSMRHFEGLSHPEIAERLGSTPAAVRQKWVRALRGLRERLAEDG